MVVGVLSESTQVAVVGAGPGGYVAAIRLAQLGKEVTLISRDTLPGGECLLRGCIPSKALIEATKLHEKFKNAETMGIFAKNIRIDLKILQNWKEKIVEKLGKGVLQLLKQNKVHFLQGEAFFRDAQTLELSGPHGNQQLTFEQAIIATGSKTRPLKNMNFDGKNIISSHEALALQELPPSLLVIGGGYIGLELGGVYARLGSQVTVVEATGQLLPGLDPDLLRPLKKNLKEMGVTVHLNTLAEAPKKTAKVMEVQLKNQQGEIKKISVTHILIAVGRSPNSDGLGLEKIGVALDKNGFIKINEKCQTNLPHIYAIGDVAGGMMLAHKASREGKVAAANIAGQKDAFENLVPAVIFTDPEIAYVGLQEPEAKAQGLEAITGIFSFGALGRAMTMEETEGFVKVVAEKKSKRILGVQMVGPHVSDLISEATLGIEMGATLEDFTLTIHPHPTLPEALEEAMESALGMPIHRYQGRKNA